MVSALPLWSRLGRKAFSNRAAWIWMSASCRMRRIHSLSYLPSTMIVLTVTTTWIKAQMGTLHQVVQYHQKDVSCLKHPQTRCWAQLCRMQLHLHWVHGNSGFWIKPKRSASTQKKKAEEERLLEEKKRHQEKEHEEKIAVIEEKIQEWLKIKRDQKKQEQLLKQSEEQEATKREQEKQREIEQKAQQKYKEWLQKKNQEKAEQEKKQQEKAALKEEQERERRQKAEEKFRQWLKQANTKNTASPKSPCSSPYGKSYPSPSFYNPIPWKPIHTPPPETINKTADRKAQGQPKGLRTVSRLRDAGSAAQRRWHSRLLVTVKNKWPLIVDLRNFSAFIFESCTWLYSFHHDVWSNLKMSL